MLLEYDVRQEVALIAASDAKPVGRARALLRLSKALEAQVRRLRRGCDLLRPEDPLAEKRLAGTMRQCAFLREEVRAAASAALREDPIRLETLSEPIAGPSPFVPALPDPEVRREAVR